MFLNKLRKLTDVSYSSSIATLNSDVYCGLNIVKLNLCCYLCTNCGHAFIPSFYCLSGACLINPANLTASHTLYCASNFIDLKNQFIFLPLCLVTYNGELYIFGGYNAHLDRHFNDLWKFNPGDSVFLYQNGSAYWAFLFFAPCMVICFWVTCIDDSFTSIEEMQHGYCELVLTHFHPPSLGGHVDNPLLLSLVLHHV